MKYAPITKRPSFSMYKTILNSYHERFAEDS